MEDNLSRKYLAYLRGCQKLNKTPVSREEFEEKRRLYYCLCVSDAKRRSSFKLLKAMGKGSVWSTLYELKEIEEAVIAGEEDDEGYGGAGVTANPYIGNPPLVGAGAKLIPYLDPEPAWRDP